MIRIVYFMIGYLSILKYNTDIPPISISTSQLHVKKTYKLAFGLLAHDEESIVGLMELLDQIYTKEHVYMVHFDLKAPSESIKHFESKYPDIIQTKTRFDVQWGSFSMCRAQLELAMMDMDYDHLVYLDGHSFVMKPFLEIELDLLKIPLRDSIVLSNDPGYGSLIPTCKEGSPTMQACSRSSARCLDAECKKYSDTPNNAPLFKGPQWSILSKAFIDYMKSQKHWLDEWIHFFDTNYIIPDEAFYATLLLDSPFKDDRFLYDQDWLRTVWLDCKSEHTDYSRIGYSPCFLGLNDYEPHLKGSTSLFVRKIRPGNELRKKLLNSVK
eukprot:NODE_89_length_21781_cov_0.895836.p7 type:complete len:326 gc:universal NODE_89_length_21781_cov_0.895836:1062-85(-)